ncbi:Extracellular serine/threonine protein kinase FAM20C [Holothuria leucospilota]|uniref:Extracellular serine/threonine protein kinase FAM20C n=1 Tax=Holothuria leucospilota TaxID=206669 RepID=A0A9Q1C7T8_HOLLE|nr:Extracellular serine/threonine protein kinase FAM20C [Holothuria leucospilota]
MTFYNVFLFISQHRYVRKYGLFLDFMDIAIFDHLMLNYDRHSFVILRNKRNRTKTGLVLFDNGKGFGDPFNDDLTFLTPIKQCCQFRNSTYQRVVQLTNIKTRLSELMRASLLQVPLHVLTGDFYSALDRRLEQVVKEMDICIEKFGAEKVFSEEW